MYDLKKKKNKEEENEYSFSFPPFTTVFRGIHKNNVEHCAQPPCLIY